MLSNASSIAKHRTMVDYDNTKVENKIKMYYYVLVLVINSSIAISIAKHRTMVDYDNTKVEIKIKTYYNVLVLVINSSIAMSLLH